MTEVRRPSSNLTQADYENIYYSYYVDEGLGLGAIGKKLGIPKTNLSRNLKKYDLPLRSNSEGTHLSNRKWSDLDIATMYQHDHIQKKMTFEEISEVHGISPSRFSSRCARLGLQSRSKAEATECFWEKLEPEIRKMYERYLDDDITVEEIAKELNISTSQAFRRFKHFGFQARSPKGSNLTDVDVSQIVNLYSEGQAPREIEENLDSTCSRLEISVLISGKSCAILSLYH